MTSTSSPPPKGEAIYKHSRCSVNRLQVQLINEITAHCCSHPGGYTEMRTIRTPALLRCIGGQRRHIDLCESLKESGPPVPGVWKIEQKKSFFNAQLAVQYKPFKNILY